MNQQPRFFAMLRPAILPLRDVQMQPIEHTETYIAACKALNCLQN